MMVETFMAQSFVLNIKCQTSNPEHQRQRKHERKQKSLQDISFFIENLRILLYNKQVYSCIIHL